MNESLERAPADEVHVMRVLVRVHEPRTEEIRLKILDLQTTPFFWGFFSEGDSVYSREKYLKILGTPVKTHSKVTATPVQTCLKSWQS